MKPVVFHRVAIVLSLVALIAVWTTFLTVPARGQGAMLRGQGPQFVLEFTALIVIIFLAVVLGVLGVLKEQQIGTLLAAIAGYVLGKATIPRATAAGETTKGKV